MQLNMHIRTGSFRQKYFQIEDDQLGEFVLIERFLHGE